MIRIFSFLLTISMAATAWGLEVDERVDNFRLLDHNGASHELYYYDDAKAVVFMVQGNGCPIVRNAMPRFTELRDKYAAQGVEFFMINTNLQDNRTSIAKEAGEYGYEDEAALRASDNVAEILTLLSQQLRAQREASSRYLIGDQLSALDIYWATFAAMVSPLPEDRCPMPDYLRQSYSTIDEQIEAAADPLLLEHRDFIYETLLELPVVID